MPIPKIPKHPPMAPIRPPKPRQILPSTKEAQEIDLDIPLETCEELHEDYLDERFLTETKVPRLSRCMVYPSPKVISVSTFKGISDVMLTNRPMKIPLPPPCPSEYMTGSCEKHSRCHCNLLSKNERDFFKLTPQKWVFRCMFVFIDSFIEILYVSIVCYEWLCDLYHIEITI